MRNCYQLKGEWKEYLKKRFVRISDETNKTLGYIFSGTKEKELAQNQAMEDKDCQVRCDKTLICYKVWGKSISWNYHS